MRRLMLGIFAAAMTAALFGGGARLVEHNHGAQNAVCLGNQTADGKCDVAWVNWSVESRKNAAGDDSKYVNCPRGTTTQPECYQKYDDSRTSQTNWGTSANTALVGDTKAGPLELGGIYYGTGAADAHVWVGVRAQGEGSGSVSVAGGRNGAGKTYECVTLYGADETPDHAISGRLNDAGISDDRTDYDTDGQVCGELLRGF